MPWYRTGTVAVTLNSTTVTGTGTTFSQNARVGDAFQGPDGKWYEVTNIASATVLSILPAYTSATASAGSYALAPMQGYVKQSADTLRTITNQYGTTLGILGSPVDAAGLRANIGAAKSGVSTDITSITGLTTMLPINQGGTGGSTAATARTNLGLGTSATLAASTGQTIDSLNLGSGVDLTRIAEAVYAARSTYGFYTGGSSSINIDTVPNGWCGLVSTSTAGTLPPLGGSFFWLETQATYTSSSTIQTAVQYAGSATTGTLLLPQVAIRIRNSPGTAWGPWGRIQTTQDIVASSTDTSSGKLLTTGYMGIGATSSIAITDLNAVNPTGFTWITSGTANQVTGYASGSIVINSSASSAEGFDIMSARNLNGRFAVRRRVSGTLGNWIEPYMPWNIVGTVAGTSAAVTGAIIERGSNANGNYTKYADGTMICWNTITTTASAIGTAFMGGFRSTGYTWTFPAAFNAAPVIEYQVDSMTAFGATGVSRATTACGYVFTAVTSQAAADRTASMFAIGRWAN